MIDVRPLRPAYAATAAWLAVGLLLDLNLVRRDRRPITHALRTKPGLLFLLVLNLHVLDRLGPADPFRCVAKRVRH